MLFSSFDTPRLFHGVLQLLLEVSGVHDAILSRVGTVDLLLGLVLPSEAAFQASW